MSNKEQQNRQIQKDRTDRQYNEEFQSDTEEFNEIDKFVTNGTPINSGRRYNYLPIRMNDEITDSDTDDGNREDSGIGDCDRIRLSELEEVQLQIGRVTDESLESTRRMLVLVEESGEAGSRTLEALDEQRRQLNRVEEGMDNINSDMKSAEKALKNLKRCCNICSFPSDRVSKEEKCNMQSDAATNLECNVIVNQPRLVNNDAITNRSTYGTAANEYITRITKDAREDEMNSNLNQVDSMLGVLRNMAVDMNTELQSQNGQLVRIIQKADSNNIHLDQVNTSANDLLNKK